MTVRRIAGRVRRRSRLGGVVRKVPRSGPAAPIASKAGRLAKRNEQLAESFIFREPPNDGGRQTQRIDVLFGAEQHNTPAVTLRVET
jgi:hypothetical protein